jgi:hypothetical protein
MGQILLRNAIRLWVNNVEKQERKHMLIAVNPTSLAQI